MRKPKWRIVARKRPPGHVDIVNAAAAKFPTSFEPWFWNEMVTHVLNVAQINICRWIIFIPFQRVAKRQVKICKHFAASAMPEKRIGLGSRMSAEIPRTFHGHSTDIPRPPPFPAPPMN